MVTTDNSSNNSAKKKYTLHAAKPGEKAPCAFFQSAAGCRNGDACKFLHILASGNSGTIQVDAGSVVSSESEQEEEKAVVRTKQSKKKDKKKAKQEQQQQQPQDPRGSISNTYANAQVVEDIFAPRQTTTTPEQQQRKKSKNRRSLNGDPFANPPKSKKAKTGEVAVPPQQSQSTTPFAAKGSEQQQKKQQQPTPPLSSNSYASMAVDPTTNTPNKIPDFRSLDLPVASFSINKNGVGTVVVKQNNTPTPPPPPPPDPKTVLPRDPTAQKLIPAIQATRQHARYANVFDETRWKESMAHIDTAQWIQAKPYGDWCKNNPSVLAIDCEMCETVHPTNGTHNAKALCRVSIVNASTSEVLLDTLVKPDWPVVDYRTRINGVTADHLRDVTFTLQHAQAFLLALCSQETVILGQAVHNDLQALHMLHYCVADSAYLYVAADNPTATVGLKDLVAGVLHQTMPDTHDSVNDAECARKVIEYWIAKKGVVEPVVRSAVQARKLYAAQLFCHRLPHSKNGNFQKQHLEKLFLGHTNIQPESVDDIEYAGSNGNGNTSSTIDNGKTIVHFSSPAHAQLAFATLAGKAETDNSGRLQKRVYLKAGGYIRVRKMAYENSSSTNAPPEKRKSL